ncbi:hypothetical protein GY45DRAFT_1341282 [Cubamyces sp. BRFM 1775]|nr:hypothetical protein GY45DRAFT_1341282 [Cubamyces sp. BRFM 1775]
MLELLTLTHGGLLALTLLKATEDTQTHSYKCQACEFDSEAEGDCNVLWDTSKEIWKNSLYSSGSYKGQDIQAWIGAILNQKSTKIWPQSIKYEIAGDAKCS